MIVIVEPGLIEEQEQIVNIVTLPTGQKYHVDVGFGGDGPIQPSPLGSGAFPSLIIQKSWITVGYMIIYPVRYNWNKKLCIQNDFRDCEDGLD